MRGVSQSAPRDASLSVDTCGAIRDEPREKCIPCIIPHHPLDTEDICEQLRANRRATLSTGADVLAVYSPKGHCDWPRLTPTYAWLDEESHQHKTHDFDEVMHVDSLLRVCSSILAPVEAPPPRTPPRSAPSRFVSMPMSRRISSMTLRGTPKQLIATCV
jgi:hypothetical protein